jgi:hypothetical protein
MLTPSGRGGRHGHHLTARNSGVVRAGQLQAEAAPVHAQWRPTRCGQSRRSPARGWKHHSDVDRYNAGARLELVVCEVIVDGICRQPVNVSVLQVSNGSSSQRGELRLHDVGRCRGRAAVKVDSEIHATIRQQSDRPAVERCDNRASIIAVGFRCRRSEPRPERRAQDRETPCP